MQRLQGTVDVAVLGVVVVFEYVRTNVAGELERLERVDCDAEVVDGAPLAGCSKPCRTTSSMSPAGQLGPVLSGRMSTNMPSPRDRS